MLLTYLICNHYDGMTITGMVFFFYLFVFVGEEVEEGGDE